MSYFDLWKQFVQSDGKDIREKLLFSAQNNFDDYFERTPTRVTGTINGIECDFVLQNHSYVEKINDEKLLIAPNDLVINIGDIVEWDGKVFLVYNRENRAIKTHQVFNIAYCNNTIKYMNKDKEVISFYAVNTRYNLGTTSADKEKKIPKGDIALYVRDDEKTNWLTENFRFVIGNKAVYKIVDINDFGMQTEGVLVIYLDKTSKNSEDDFVNRIAYNGDIDVNDNTDGIQFDVEELSIIEGLVGTASIYEYDADGLPLGTTFTFTIEGIEPELYYITNRTGNSISIEPNSSFHQGKLKAISDSDGTEREISLKFISF